MDAESPNDFGEVEVRYGDGGFLGAGQRGMLRIEGGILSFRPRGKRGPTLILALHEVTSAQREGWYVHYPLWAHICFFPLPMVLQGVSKSAAQRIKLWATLRTERGDAHRFVVPAPGWTKSGGSRTDEFIAVVESLRQNLPATKGASFQH